MKSLTIGSRGSKLALAQSNQMAERIRALVPGLEVTVRIIRTTGDKLATASLVKLAADTKGLFVKEIEEALLDRSIDLAVHSLKDVPTQLPEGLWIAAVPEREDPRDAVVTRLPAAGLADLPEGSRIGTSSLRREVQLLRLRPDFRIVPIRGNVDTRLRKLHDEDLQAVVLASAGLVRLGLDDRISFRFPVEEMIPAIGQGALAIEARREDDAVTELLKRLEDADTRRAVEAERAFLLGMGGGCQVPMGAHACKVGAEWCFVAFVSGVGGTPLWWEKRVCAENDLPEAALSVAAKFKATGAGEALRGEGR